MYQWDDLMTDDEDDLPPGWPKEVKHAPPCYTAPLHLNNVESTLDKNFKPAYPSIFHDVEYLGLFGCQQGASTSNSKNQTSSVSNSNFNKSKNCQITIVKDDNLIDLITDDEDDIIESKRFETSRPVIKNSTNQNENVLKITKQPTTNSRRFHPQFSQTQFEMNSILQKKRALREKNETTSSCSGNGSKSDFSQTSAFKAKSALISVTPKRREFGRAFSPTVYTPTREERFSDEYSFYVTSEVGKFLALLLSMDINAIRMDYSEEIITKHLRNQGMQISSEFSGNFPLIYNSYEDYKKTYLPFIFYDCWAQMVEDYFSNNSKRIPVLLRSADTKTDPKVTTLVLRCLIPSNQVHLDAYSIENWLTFIQIFDENSESVSSSNEVLKNKKALGFVYNYNYKLAGIRAEEALRDKDVPVLKSSNDETCTSYTPCEYTVKVFSNSTILELIKSQAILTLRPVYYIRPTIRYIETISMMKFKDQFQQTFLKPDKNVCVLNCNQPDDFDFYEAEKFNEQQKNAIVSCFNAVQLPYSTNKTVMIQGPPGTGKTHTLVGIIKNLMINCQFGKSKPLRILVCAPSNGAIDVIALRLIRDQDFLKDFKETKLSIVRIGQRTQVHPDVKPYLLEQLVEQNYKFVNRSRHKSELREDLMLNAHVILSTLSSVQQTCMNMFRKERVTSRSAIRCVIIDEASQSTEVELLMPLIYPISKVIMIGDHLQLPATVISRHALNRGYDRSLFERLFLHFDHMNMNTGHSNPMITLVRQFRMNKAICNFPSAQFYKNMLETPYGIGVNWRIPVQPYLVFDVANANERCTTSLVNPSKFNTAESEYIFKLILMIFDKLGYTVTADKIYCLPEKLNTTIGVITFYRGQKIEIIRRLQVFDNGILLKHIDVNTVDAFQGQERDIIILSCVRALERTNDFNSVGFVRSQQRMNVALTRAKSVLFVMIHAKSFEHVPRWDQLLVDAQARQCLVRLTSQTTDEMLKKIISK